MPHTPRHSVITENTATDLQDESRFRALVEGFADPLLVLAPSNLVYYANGAFTRCFGYSLEEIRGRSYHLLINLQDTTRLDAYLNALPNAQELPITCEICIRHRDGNVETRQVTFNLLPEPEGAPLIVLQFHRAAIPALTGNHCEDGIAAATYNNLAEEQLYESEERFRLLFETMVQGVVYQDAQGNIIAANPAAEKILGVSREQMSQRTSNNPNWRALRADGSAFPGEQHPAMVALKTGKPVYEVVMGVWNPQANEYRWILINALPEFRGNAPAPCRVYTTFTDITERKHAEESMRRYNEQLTTVLDIEHQLAISLNQQVIYETLLEGTQKLFPDAVAIIISRYDEDHQLIHAAAGVSENERIDVTALPALPLAEDGKGKQSQVIRTGKPLIVQSGLKAYQRVGVLVDFRAGEPDTQSGMYVPMLAQNKTLGLIQCQSYTPARFSVEDVRILSLVANTAAVSLQNARLLETAQAEIAERKQTEQRLRQSESLLAEAQRIGRIGHIEWSGRGNNLICSDELYTILGLPSSEMISQYTIAAMMLPEERTRLQALDRLAFSRRGNLDYEFRICRPDGQERWLHHVGKFTYAKDGTPLRMIATVQDVTERKQAELALQRSERVLRLFVEYSPAAIAMFDREMRYIVASQRYLTDYRLGEQELTGRSHYEVFPEMDGARREIHERCLQGTIAKNDADALLRTDGRLDWVRYELHPWYEANNEIGGLIFFSEVITERKQAEEQASYRQKLLEKVLTLGKNITAINELDACLREIHHSVQHELGFDQVRLFLYDANTNLIHGAYSTNQHGEAKETSLQVELAEALPDWQDALRSPAGLSICTDYQTAHNPPPEHPMYGVKEHITLAAWAGGKPVALLSVDNFALQRQLSAADLEALQLFAGYAGLAIANAQLHAGLEQRIRQRTADVQDLYDNAPTGYHSLDGEGRILLINQTELNWLGYTRESLIGQPFANLLTAASRENFLQNFPLFKQRGWVRDVEFELIRKDGSTFHVLVNATAITDALGNYVMSRSTVFDNTERKQAESNLRESETQNRLLFDESPEAVILFNSQGKIARLNRAFENLSGCSREQLLGNDITHLQLLPENLLSKFVSIVTETYEPNATLAAIEFAIRRADGEIRDVSVRVFPLTLQNQRHYLVSMHDITTRKRTAETLRAANLELERAMRMKDEFLASMSHELRTPLTGILGLAEALQLQTYGNLTEKQLKSLKNIENSGRHLLDLINDILDLSKIEAGKLEMQLKPCSVSEVCQVSLQLIKGMAQNKGQNVHFSISPETLVVYADARRLKQMLVNLLSNAIKFTPQGGTIGLDVQGCPDEQQVALTVWDTGVGISAENLKRLFKPFVQLDSSLARQYSGTGLGLSLVQRMADLHGGSVQVESQPGEGSRFTILLPWSPDTRLTMPHSHAKTTGVQNLPIPMAASASLTTPAAQPNLPKVVIVDDHHIILETISDFLNSQQFHVLTAHSGLELLNLLPEHYPDIILMDIQMPGMDGLETTRRVRAHKDPRIAHIPIIAITALAMPGDREMCLAAGANEYVSKPIKLQLLKNILQKVLGTRHP